MQRGEKVPKKKEEEKGRAEIDRVRAHGTVAGGVTTAEASSTLHVCRLPLGQRGDPIPTHMSPRFVRAPASASVAPRHATPAPAQKKSHVVFRSGHRTRARAHHEPQQSARKEAGWGSWLVHLTCLHIKKKIVCRHARVTRGHVS
jgi:hypothetical protein